MAIQWTEDLATGVEAIDDQHRELYATVASLHAAMRRGMQDEIPNILAFLEQYVTQHFALEEREMAKAGYPGLQAHQEAHQAFITEFLRQKSRLAVAANSDIMELSSWLGAWLRDHVRGVDGEMARFLGTARAHSATYQEA